MSSLWSDPVYVPMTATELAALHDRGLAWYAEQDESDRDTDDARDRERQHFDAEEAA